MIGNDVVDILQSRIESNWQRRGFLDKLFCSQEHEMIEQANDAEKMVWRLWSMKEAAYKIYNRQTGIRAFMPLSLCCTIEDSIHGAVSCKDHFYYTKTTITNNVIHTIAVCNKNDFALMYEPESLLVAKDSNGLPHAKGNDGEQYPASISHHGAHLKIVGLKRALIPAEA